MEPYENFDFDKTIKNLLKKLVEENDDLTWKMRVTYSSGGASNLIELSFYTKPNLSRHGTIAFDTSNGIVSNFFYRNMTKENKEPENIIDLLLDIINLEKEKSS